ncbi:uncharacterized protein BDW43DRAFT_308365 [Aspergillus alliaceus]|uniref:uncharacterized protein n=1 Tax=Petromyces alliaceus TaxID=209559 RepID=UPI0012A412E2|nr:uncharacterized protein BDW43DRAFT_308365 [Aspergillus alliaceus]KAB8236687.1 hypothetical protein BDW43DRAFT_308365 [Aspergillus alliaceus]
MATVARDDLDEISDALSMIQLASVKKQLARLLDFMRRKGYDLQEQHPIFLRYDRTHDRFYLVDPTFIGLPSLRIRYQFPLKKDDVFVEPLTSGDFPMVRSCRQARLQGKARLESMLVSKE